MRWEGERKECVGGCKRKRKREEGGREGEKVEPLPPLLQWSVGASGMRPAETCVGGKEERAGEGKLVCAMEGAEPATARGATCTAETAAASSSQSAGQPVAGSTPPKGCGPPHPYASLGAAGYMTSPAARYASPSRKASTRCPNPPPNTRTAEPPFAPSRTRGRSQAQPLSAGTTAAEAPRLTGFRGRQPPPHSCVASYGCERSGRARAPDSGRHLVRRAAVEVEGAAPYTGQGPAV